MWLCISTGRLMLEFIWLAGCWSSWHDEWRPTGEVIHHDAVYQTVHHDAVYQTVHHDAETTVVHHDATGHYETVVTQAAWMRQ